MHAYRSTDLVNWDDRGIALKVSSDPTSEIGPGCIIERPKVIRNAKTGNYVMYFHLELKGQGYSAAKTGIALANRPEGPFVLVQTLRPNGAMSRDMTLFVDDDGKGEVRLGSVCTARIVPNPGLAADGVLKDDLLEKLDHGRGK